MSPAQHKFGPSKIAEFYAQNNVVFLTGTTGFVGKAILEKLLRSCPQITKVYLLLRISGAKTVQDRVEHEILSSRIFDTLKAQFASAEDFHDTIVKKIVPVQGDLTIDLLGLSDKDLAMVREDVNVIINSAASVSFDDPLNEAIEMNTKGPLRIFDVAQGAKNIAACVQISTCYVNSIMPGGAHVDEKVYAHPIGDPEEIYHMLSKMSYQEIRQYERSVVLKTYPNTYTFTKSLTEHLIQTRYKAMNLPVVIVRPSAITGTHQEPVPGWAEGITAANKAIVSCALGHVQEWIGVETNKVDFIPVDIVAKVTLLSATVADRARIESPVYHVGTTCSNPITWTLFGTYLEAYWNTVQKPHRRISDDVRFEMFPVAEFKRRFDIRFGEHIRALAWNKDNKNPKDRISKAMSVPKTFAAFASRERFFDISNSVSLDEAAPIEFKSGMRQGIDWHEYMQDYNTGVHQFIICEKVNRSLIIEYSQRRIQPTIPMLAFQNETVESIHKPEAVARL